MFLIERCVTTGAKSLSKAFDPTWKQLCKLIIMLEVMMLRVWTLGKSIPERFVYTLACEGEVAVTVNIGIVARYLRLMGTSGPDMLVCSQFGLYPHKSITLSHRISGVLVSFLSE